MKMSLFCLRTENGCPSKSSSASLQTSYVAPIHPAPVSASCKVSFQDQEMYRSFFYSAEVRKVVEGET